jgi:hypothetical protein
MNKLFFGFVLFLIITFSYNVNAQVPSISISGEGIEPVIITKSMFSEMKQVVIMAKGHDDIVHRYSGVTLSDILVKAGIVLGDSVKNKTANSYVIITAADNYKAIYSLPEVDPLFAGRSIILADRADKKPLPAEDGPFQIVVPGEKKHTRWIRQVNSIQVVSVK